MIVSLMQLFLALMTTTVTLSVPKGDPTDVSGPARVLHFPADRSLGVVFVRDRGEHDSWHTEWVRLPPQPLPDLRLQPARERIGGVSGVRDGD